MNMPDETTGTLNGASTSVPGPTAVAVPPGTAIIPAPGGTTLTLNEVVTNSVLQGYQGNLTVVMGNYDASTNNNYAGATVNNAERQTIYTGGGAPNGTGGSPTVSASAFEAAVADLTKLCQDIQENVTGQGERLQTTMTEQFEEHESSIKAFVRKTLQEPVAAYQTPMTGVPNRQPYSAS